MLDEQMSSLVFVREDHISDEVFESMGTQDILDMIARREIFIALMMIWVSAFRETAR